MRTDLEEDKQEIKEYLNAFGFQVNKDPFPTTPPKNVDYWADNEKVFKEIIQMEIDSLLFDSSTLNIFWGPIGGGKTFAAFYLKNPSSVESITKQLNIPVKPTETLVVPATRPIKSGQMIYNIHSHIIADLFSKILKNEGLIKEMKRHVGNLPEGEIKEAFRSIAKSAPYGIFGEHNIDSVISSEGYKYLTNGKSKIGKASDIFTLTTITKELITIISTHYKRTVVAIDELENLTKVGVTERLLVNDYLRRLFDDNPSGITLILVFTFDSYEEVTTVLDRSVVSRTRRVINFNYPDERDIETYIKDCIESRSLKKVTDVMEQGVLKKIVRIIIETLGNDRDFRKINAQMHSIFRKVFETSGKPLGPIKITSKLLDQSFAQNADEIAANLKKGQKKD